MKRKPLPADATLDNVRKSKAQQLEEAAQELQQAQQVAEEAQKALREAIREAERLRQENARLSARLLLHAEALKDCRRHRRPDHCRCV